MGTLDRYVVRSFLTTAALCFLTLMMLRIVGDLFTHIDEFAELQFDTVFQRVLHIVRYYGYQSFMYFAELGGIIIVSSAAFTLAVMNHTNELTAMLAAGVSLHRVSLPIVICAMAMGGLVIVDQELIIPRIASELVISPDERPDTMEFEVRLVEDSKSSVWYATRYYAGRELMQSPVIMARDRDFGLIAVISGRTAKAATVDGEAGWLLTGGRISPTARLGRIWPHNQDSRTIWTNVSPLQLLRKSRDVSGQDVPLERIEWASDLEMYDGTYDMTVHARRFEPGPKPANGGEQWTGTLIDPVFTFKSSQRGELASVRGKRGVWHVDKNGDGYWSLTGGVLFYTSDLTADDLVLREASNWMDYMSTSDLTRLIDLRRVRDRRAAELIKHSRFTAPINNLVMLLLGLPFILSRERNIKASATLSLLTVGTFFAFMFLCRYVGLPPLIGAWLPVFLFGPIAIIMFDAVKT